MPAKSKQQQKFFGVVKAMQKGDIPKKGEAGEVADDMTKKEVDKMASTKHKNLVNKIKELVEQEISSLTEVNQKVFDIYAMLGKALTKATIIPKAYRADYGTSLINMSTRDERSFMKDYGMFSIDDFIEDMQYNMANEAKLPDEGFSDPEQMREAKSANALRSDYEKAVKKEQSLSSLLLVNLEKYKAAKANGNETAIAKHTKIAATLSKKKIDATEKASKAYKVYQDKITGLHADAELELKEIEANDDTEFNITLKHLLDKHVAKGGEVEESKVNEATDMNDPVLMAFRATRKEFPKLKPAKTKSRRLSFDKYMDLLDSQTDIDQDIKDKAQEMGQTLRDMEQEAEPEGGKLANKYSSIMMKQEKEYAKLKAKKAKIDAKLEKHRMD